MSACLSQEEADRLDHFSTVIYDIAGRKILHNAPLVGTPYEIPQLRILDLGCGSGFWAMEMAEYVSSRIASTAS